jgi:hypothetical protein
MITQILRLMLLAGLLIFPPVTAALAIGIPGGAGLGHHGPVMCGPGPDC